MKTDLSKQWFDRACLSLVGGVNSPVRAFKAVDYPPVVIAKGEGLFIYDIDGNPYIDLVGSYGPNILGHAHPEVLSFVYETISKGFSFGSTTPLEILLAEKIKSAVPSIDKIRFVNSGTEAVMSAIRLARAYTGKNKIVKFNGCYHGHSDALLVAAGSGVATLSIPSTKGVTEAAIKDTIVIEYNDSQALRNVFDQYGNDIAAVILESVAGNMGVVIPDRDFIDTLHLLKKEFSCLIIADEVMSGFRKHFGLAADVLSISADIYTLGKVIGGGMPVGAYAARSEIMDLVAPLGHVYQAGTLSGNPASMACGLKTLEILQTIGYDAVNKHAEKLAASFSLIAEKLDVPLVVNQFGSMLNPFFTRTQVKNFIDAQNSDISFFKAFFKEFMQQGVYIPPSPFEAWFLPVTIDENTVELIIEKFETAIKLAKKNITAHSIQ